MRLLFFKWWIIARIILVLTVVLVTVNQVTLFVTVPRNGQEKTAGQVNYF